MKPSLHRRPRQYRIQNALHFGKAAELHQIARFVKADQVAHPREDGDVGNAVVIADIAIFPWVRNLIGFYEARDLVQFGRFAEVQRVLDAFVARPAVQRGLQVPAA